MNRPVDASTRATPWSVRQLGRVGRDQRVGVPLGMVGDDREGLGLVGREVGAESVGGDAGRGAVGRTRWSGAPKLTRRNGRPNRTSTVTIESETTTGRRMTHDAVRCQKPDSPATGAACRAGRCGRALTREPSTTSTAGSVSTDASIDTSVTPMPAQANDRRK